MPTAAKQASVAWKGLSWDLRLDVNIGEASEQRYHLKGAVEVWFLKTLVAGSVLQAEGTAGTLQTHPLQGSGPGLVQSWSFSLTLHIFIIKSIPVHFTFLKVTLIFPPRF